MHYQSDKYMFIRNKKNQKMFNIAWTILGLMVIGSMLMLYLPAFL